MYLEVNNMDLRNNQITLGELWDDPRSRAVFQRRIPMLAKHPVKGAARTVTLEQVIAVARGYIPQKTIDETLAELRRARDGNRLLALRRRETISDFRYVQRDGRAIGSSAFSYPSAPCRSVPPPPRHRR